MKLCHEKGDGIHLFNGNANKLSARAADVGQILLLYHYTEIHDRPSPTMASVK